VTHANATGAAGLADRCERALEPAAHLGAAGLDAGAPLARMEGSDQVCSADTDSNQPRLSSHLRMLAVAIRLLTHALDSCPFFGYRRADSDPLDGDDTLAQREAVKKYWTPIP